MSKKCENLKRYIKQVDSLVGIYFEGVDEGVSFDKQIKRANEIKKLVKDIYESNDLLVTAELIEDSVERVIDRLSIEELDYRIASNKERDDYLTMYFEREYEDRGAIMKVLKDKESLVTRIKIGLDGPDDDNTKQEDMMMLYVEVLRNVNNKILSLDLSTSIVNDEAFEFLTHGLVSSNNKVTELNIGNTFIRSLEYLSRVLYDRNNNIKKLLIENREGYAGSEIFFRALGNDNCKIEDLIIENTPLTSSDIGELAKSLEKESCQIKKLEISNLAKTDRVRDFYRALGHKNTKMKVLSLSHNINPSEMTLFVESLKTTECKLTELEIVQTKSSILAFAQFVDFVKTDDCRLKKISLEADLFPASKRVELEQVCSDKGIDLHVYTPSDDEL